MNLIAHLRDLAREGSSARVTASTLARAADELEAAEARIAEWKAPVPELKGSFPIVLYFRTEADREEFHAMMREEMPHFVALPLV